MSKEIERKWLLKGGDFSFPDKANVIREQLWQYYLEIIVDSDNRIISETRIRYKAGSNNGKLTYKVGNGLERLEFEDKLFSARKFVAKMSKETGKKAIKKERFTVYMDGQKPVEISIVDDTWAYAEVEFESTAEAKKYKLTPMSLKSFVDFLNDETNKGEYYNYEHLDTQFAKWES